MAQFPSLGSLCAASLIVALGCLHPLDQPSCQYNIVSSTVVAAYCSHVTGNSEALDLFIAWRGQPGWFQRRDGATGGGGGGTRLFGAGTNGRVSQYAIYNEVTIAFDADFDAQTVALGDETVSLRGVNAILIDLVEPAEARHTSTKLWVEPSLPLGVDVNLVLAQRSRELRQFLRCEVPMPTASPRRILTPRPIIVTVCEKLASQSS